MNSNDQDVTVEELIAYLDHIRGDGHYMPSDYLHVNYTCFGGNPIPDIYVSAVIQDIAYYSGKSLVNVVSEIKSLA